LPPATTWKSTEKSLILFAFANLLYIFVAKQQSLRIEVVVGGGFA
jgi:hypothetical protein